MSQFVQLCPIPDGWLAVYKQGDEEITRDCVCIALDVEQMACFVVFDEEKQMMLGAHHLEGFLRVESPGYEEDEEEESEAKPDPFADE